MPGHVFVSPGFDPGFGPAEPATSQNTEVGYGLGKTFKGWTIDNRVRFRGRPKGIKGQPMQMIEGSIRRFERRWGTDYAVVRDSNKQTYDVPLRDLESADAVSLLGDLLDADDD